MEQAIYSRSVNILKRFSNASEGELFTLYEPGVVSPFDLVQSTRYYGYVTDLRIRVDIASLPESELPNLDVTSTRTERLTAIRSMEWSSPRMELHLFLETSQQPLTNIAAVSLLNRRPYYVVNLLPYFTDNGIINFANDCRLSGRIENVGWGLLALNDSCVVYGSVKEEITTLPETIREIQYCQPHGWTVGTESQILLPINASRLQLTLVNRSESSKVYLNYGTLAELGKGICLYPKGGSYEINLSNPYAGAIAAISDSSGTLLSGLECV